MIIEWIYVIALLFLISLYQYNLSIPILILILLFIYFKLAPISPIYEGFEKAQLGFPAGYFKIRSRLNGKCLDVNGGSTNAGSRIVIGIVMMVFTNNGI